MSFDPADRPTTPTTSTTSTTPTTQPFKPRNRGTPTFEGVPIFMLPPEVAKDAKRQWELDLAATHLSDYARVALDVTPADHHELICEAIDDLLAGDYDELIILAPPGSAKSTYTSHALAAYYMGHNPDKNIILATHTGDLSERWSRKVRNTVGSVEHRRVFPKSILSTDSTAVSRWATTAGGELLAAGVGGSILGFRADCVVGDTLLTTKTGYKRIADIQPGDEILGYDRIKKAPAYGRVIAKLGREADITYRIHTTDGDVVEATGNHRFFANGHFVPANTLAVGDSLLRSLWDRENNQGVGVGEATGSESIGKTVLLQKLREFFSATSNSQTVRRVRERLLSSQKINNLLLACLFRNIATGKHSGSVLRSLREGLSRQTQNLEILLNGLQERLAFKGNALDKKSGLAQRTEPKQIPRRQWSKIPSSTESSNDPGQPSMCRVRFDGLPPGASSGYGFDSQHSRKYRDALRNLPHDSAWRGSGETAETTVSRIEEVRGKQTVWDIQVEHLSNFFAGGILVHNCGIIDDPISGFEEAQSDTQLKKVHGWYENDFVTRLKPNAKLVLICQRLARNDLAGYLIDRNVKNPTRRQRVLKLPMIATSTDDPLGRTPGDRLWPEWYTTEMVEDAQRDDYKWQTLYQQEPPSDTGSWVSTDEIKFAPSPAYDPHANAYYGLTDLALSVGKGDYTVHMVVAVAKATGDCHLVDFFRNRVDPEVSSRKLVNMCEVYKPAEWLIDDDNASKVFMQLVATAARSSSVPVNWKPLPMRGQDKETRAAPLRGMFKRGVIYLDPSKPWTNIVVNELLQFPNALGAGVDDCVDALGLLGRRLASLQRGATPIDERPKRPTIQQMTLDQLWADNTPRRRASL